MDRNEAHSFQRKGRKSEIYTRTNVWRIERTAYFISIEHEISAVNALTVTRAINYMQCYTVAHLLTALRKSFLRRSFWTVCRNNTIVPTGMKEYAIK
jgi:hypothetical protein